MAETITTLSRSKMAVCGVAIGDVSGKGISAALLMASVRSALHGLTFGGMLDLARLIAEAQPHHL